VGGSSEYCRAGRERRTSCGVFIGSRKAEDDRGLQSQSLTRREAYWTVPSPLRIVQEAAIGWPLRQQGAAGKLGFDDAGLQWSPKKGYILGLAVFMLFTPRGYA
jgi:hypothetical protein